MMLATPPTPAPAGDTLEGAVRTVHDRWISETERFLEPVLTAKASFWDRWSGVRYLGDRYDDVFQSERALVEEMRSFLLPDEAERLRQGAQALERLREELDELGRRRGTAVGVAATAREFLDRLKLWCAEIELAAARIPAATLTPEGASVLAHLEAASQAGG